MPPGPSWRARLTEPVTRYQVPLIPVLLGLAVLLWLVVTAFVDGRWLLGLATLVVAGIWSLGWVGIRRRRLRRALVLPPSALSERKAAAKAERRADVLPEDTTGDR